MSVIKLVDLDLKGKRVLIRADLNTDSVQVITSQRVSARPSDLLAAIAALPVRR